MKEKLIDIIYYIIKNYPFKLSNGQLTKLVYLSDWKESITRGKQITSLKWYFDNYGPFLWDIKDTIEENNEYFKIINKETSYGNKKTTFEILKDKPINLTSDEIKSIKYIIDITKDLSWEKFIKLVYSTYPIVTMKRYSYLDLVDLAKKYNEVRSNST